jgi:hypothetical protein
MVSCVGADQPVTEVSVSFLEFGTVRDTSGDLTVINQDDTYADVSLESGDTITFNSISSSLDTTLPLGEQLNLVPGGVQLVLRGEGKLLNTVTW